MKDEFIDKEVVTIQSLKGRVFPRQTIAQGPLAVYDSCIFLSQPEATLTTH